MNIRIDRETFDVFETFYKPRGFSELPPTPTATGGEIRAAGKVPDNYAINIVRKYDGTPDPGVKYAEAVPLHDGMWFVSVPPATY